MIIAGTHRLVAINLGSNAPGMNLQRKYPQDGNRFWRDVLKNGQTVKLPADTEDCHLCLLVDITALRKPQRLPIDLLTVIPADQFKLTLMDAQFLVNVGPD